MNNKSLIFGFISGLILLSSCSKDNELKPSKENEEIDNRYSWVENADPEQNWITSKPVQLNMVGKNGARVKFVSIGNAKATTYAETVLKGNGVYKIDIPQSDISNFGVIYTDGTPYARVKKVEITSDKNQTVDINFESPQNLAAMAPAFVSDINDQLKGNSILPDCGYMTFGSWIWNVLGKALPEGKDVVKNNTSMVDYEMFSYGDLIPGQEMVANNEEIYISFIYGFTGNKSSCVLGYYTHTGNDYSDVEFHDVTECLIYDHINGKPKVQYQLDGNTDVWYDANFDYRDHPTGQSLANLDLRRGDDAYNTKLVYDTYGSRISAVRGLTFKIDIPKGKKFGFYLRCFGYDNAQNCLNQQKQVLLAKGFPESVIPNHLLNFSYAPLNVPNANKHKSAMSIYDNFTFMGLDDNPKAGDYDCNDISFAIVGRDGYRYEPIFTDESLSSDLNQGAIKENPSISNPQRPNPNNPTGSGTVTGSMPDAEGIINQGIQRWTIGFEDGKTDIDFDFNDVVLQVAPVYYKNKVAIWLMAAGGKRETYVYYTDAKGVEHNLGEVHQLFGVSTTTMVNTVNGSEKPAVLLSGKDGLDWPSDASLTNNRGRFKIVVTEPNGIKETITAETTVNSTKAKNVPVALTVCGEWQWPLETTPVDVSYPNIGKWCKNIENQTYWNWFSAPAPGKTKSWWVNWWKKN